MPARREGQCAAAVCAASTEGCVRARDGARRIPLAVIHNQLGNAHPGITSIYLQGIDTREIIEPVDHRRPPVIRRAPTSGHHDPSASRDWHILRASRRQSRRSTGLSPERLPRLSDSGRPQAGYELPLHGSFSGRAATQLTMSLDTRSRISSPRYLEARTLVPRKRVEQVDVAAVDLDSIAARPPDIQNDHEQA